MLNENELHKEVKQTEREVGDHTPDVQNVQSDNNPDDNITPDEVDEIVKSPVDHLTSRQTENNTTGATNNDTGIFPGPEANH